MYRTGGWEKSSKSKDFTEAKLLLKADTDNDHIKHICKQVKDTGMEPHRSDEPPFFIALHDFTPFQSSHFL